MQKVIFVIIFSLCTLFASSQTTLRLKNNTSKEMFAAYVVWDRESNCYVSRGWYKLRAYRSTDLDLGDYEGTIYTHAHQYGVVDNYWGDDKLFCINPSDAFEITYAGKLNCETTAKFSSMRVSYGVNTYTFYP